MLGGAGGGKLNFGAMQGQMNRNVRMAKQRDRMRAKLAARKAQQEVSTKDQQISLLEKQLADAQKTNQLLESMQVKNTEQPKKNKKKKRRKRRNKK